MTRYRCPTCTGEFPSDALNDGACPWCEQELGEVEPEWPRTISYTKEENGDVESSGLLSKLVR